MIENFSWNENVFYTINSLAGKSDFWDSVFVFGAEPLIYIMITLFSLYFARLIRKDKKIELREIGLYFSVPFITWLFAKAIKLLLPTERPFSALENVVQLSEESIMSSFPSGHATMAFALATSIYIYNKKIGAGFFFLAFLVAISRPLVGVHYPLDILVGMTLGVIIPLVFAKIIKYYSQTKENK